MRISLWAATLPPANVPSRSESPFWLGATDSLPPWDRIGKSPGATHSMASLTTTSTIVAQGCDPWRSSSSCIKRRRRLSCRWRGSSSCESGSSSTRRTALDYGGGSAMCTTSCSWGPFPAPSYSWVNRRKARLLQCFKDLSFPSSPWRISIAKVPQASYASVQSLWFPTSSSHGLAVVISHMSFAPKAERGVLAPVAKGNL